MPIFMNMQKQSLFVHNIVITVYCSWNFKEIILKLKKLKFTRLEVLTAFLEIQNGSQHFEGTLEITHLTTLHHKPVHLNHQIQVNSCN